MIRRFARRAGPVAAAFFTAGVLCGCDGRQGADDISRQAASPAAEQAPRTVEAPAAAPANPLADSEWRLVEFQSMDDAIGSTRPEDPSVYTMRLNADGTVNMRLNCNRATGTWSVEPSADPTNGRFTFGPLAATRALCPPPSMDERIVADAASVAGYLLRDGRLYLSLMADAGIYQWQQQSGASGTDVAFEAKPDAAIEAAILAAAPDYTRGVIEDAGQGRYVYSRVDLNDDGRPEVFVYLLGSIFCGTGGCNLLLLSDSGNGYSLVNVFPISRAPVTVSRERTAGWNDLIRLESGGGAAASYVRHVFDGQTYVMQERLPVEKTPEGTRVLTGDFTFQDGAPLAAR